MGWEVTHCQWCWVLQVQVTHILASAIEGGFGRRRMGLCTDTHCQWHPSPSSGLQAARGRRELRVRLAADLTLSRKWHGPACQWVSDSTQAGKVDPTWQSRAVEADLLPSSLFSLRHGRGSSLWVDSWAAAVRQSVWGPGRNSAGSRHSVRSHLARVWIRRTKCQAGRAAAKWQIIIFWRDTKPPTYVFPRSIGHRSFPYNTFWYYTP